MVITKAVIAAAGLGTRLLSATKEQPKEMLPLFARDGEILCLKPAVQQVFEQLFDSGLREFYFVVGKGKRAIEDHFTPDREFVGRLSGNGKRSQAAQLEGFYNRIDESTMVWVNQPKPKGFGDAVLCAERLVHDESFIVHAGDTCLMSRTHDIPTWLTKTHLLCKAEATLVLKEVIDPRQYGVATIIEKGKTNCKGGSCVEVVRVVEKPSHPKSSLAIMPIYAFAPTIFEAIKKASPGVGDEIQLTDAIQALVERDHRVRAIRLGKHDIQLDIGSPESYWQALELSYRRALSKK